MLNATNPVIGQTPRIAGWPGIAIVLAVPGGELRGDGLGNTLDPTEEALRGIKEALRGIKE